MKFFKVPLRQNTFMPPLLRSIIHNNPQDPILCTVQAYNIIPIHRCVATIHK